MTWTRQQRAHHRLAKLFGPFRQDAIDRALIEAYRDRTPVVIGVAGPHPAEPGYVKDLTGDRVFIGLKGSEVACASIPRRMVRYVEAWQPGA